MATIHTVHANESTARSRRRAAVLTWGTAALALLGATTASCSPPAEAALSVFTLGSPDLVAGTFPADTMLASFGCHGHNRSPALAWSNAPAGTQRFAIQMIDLDAPTGSGFWHWAIYDLPGTATGLAGGADALPTPAIIGNTDFRDTGFFDTAIGYAGPCPPIGDKPHRYRITLYAYTVPNLAQAGGIPVTGSAALYSFVLNKGLGDKLLGKTSLEATSRR